MTKNETIKIKVTGCPFDMRGWFTEKSVRVLEELSFLADTLHRPGEEAAGGWKSKEEEIDFHLYHAIKNALAIASIATGEEMKLNTENIEQIIQGGHKGYLELRENSQA